MLSKNNNRELQRKIDDRQDRFTLRKLSIGVASVLLGSFIMGTQLSQTAYASNDNSTAITETTPQASLPGSNDASNQFSAVESASAPVSASSNQNNQVHTASEEVTTTSNNSSSTNSSSAAKTATASSQSSQTSAALTNNNPSSTPVMAASGSSDSIQTLTSNSQASLNTQQASITDAPDYPNTNGMIPQNQYIFDQFHLTNGQLTDNVYMPLNMVITLATNRNEPGGILNYYITNDQYTQQYSNGTINVGEMQTYEGPYQGSKINIYNFGENGISVNELNNNYGLAFTFGYGKYQALIKENPNPYAADSVSNAWGDTMPEKVTQTIKYVNEKTGEEISGIQPYTQTGLTGQVYSAGKNDQIVIKGYYLVNSSRANGIISQFHNGGTYTNEWVSASGQLIKEVWHQISQNGLMQCDIYINGQQQYDPNNLKGIVYPSSQSSLGPTSLSIQNGNYVFPNPYVEQTQNIELKYLPLGKIIPVLPNGEVIPNAPQPQYQNNPNDPTGVKPDEPVPVIPGYTPQEQTVTPEDPGKDTQVIYTPIQQGSITVTVHDVTDNVNLPQYGKSSGEQDVGTGFTYDKNTVITDLENKGYKVLNPDAVIPTTISKGAQNIVINVEHELVPVTPENPGQPDQPINPNDPNGPKWPDGTAKDDLEATGTQTIHYEGAGDKTPADNTQHFTFMKSATVDKVTGKIVSETGWNVASHTFGNVNTPVVAGYHADKAVAGGATITPNDLNKTIVVTYAPNGHIIPVGPDDTPIPGADQPQFPTNPDNPSETTPGQVPDVPGYHPETGKPGDPVDPVPGKPGEDVPVKYVPDTPIEQGSITVTVHDVTDNVNLPQYGKSSGEENVGTTFTYDKNTVIQELENKGYKILNPGVVIPTTISKGAQNIVINVKHELVPVTPENPGTPGQPINPNDPDGPKWPDGTAKDDLEATGTQTIHYEGAGDKTPADNTQHFTFMKSATVDKVTGKIVSETGWNVASHTFGNVNTPVVAGYHADKAVAGGATITPNDLNKTIVVTYAPNGHVIPVGPDGNPIPGADQPQFPTNPDNPTGTTPSEVPVVPGYHPETGKPGDPVDPVPGQPGENVPVKYVPDTPTPETYTGSQTIKFVDGTTGKEIETPNVQTAPDLTGDHTFGKINTPVIKGYTTTQTTAGGATVTKTDSNATITVTYTPNGHIIPVGPDGTPIPGADQPQFPTNPDNPSETTPGQVPDVPGYHPENGKPGDPVDPVPGQPGENVPVKYVPDTPVEQGSITVTVHDVTDNVNLPQYGKTSGEENVGTTFTYDKNTVIQELENKGYKILNPDAVIPTTISKGAQNIVINVKHELVPVTPENPGQPDQPINPNDPNGPKWPDGTAKNDLEATGTQTIHYVGAGDQTPANNVQHFTFTKSAVVDKVTGKIVSETGWNVASHTFGNIDTPVVSGYHADKAVAGGTTITPNDLNKTVTVTYTPNGHIIPVGSDGKPLPNVPQPQYPTNPNNPTEVTPNEPVPEIPGYTPNVSTVTPENPGENTPVVYTPNEKPVGPTTSSENGTPNGNTGNLTTPQPETPAKPMTPTTTPAGNGNIPTNEQTTSPAGSSVTTSNVNNANATTPVAQKQAAQLPQTGNEQLKHEGILGLLALGVAGLLAFGKKRRKE